MTYRSKYRDLWSALHGDKICFTEASPFGAEGPQDKGVKVRIAVYRQLGSAANAWVWRGNVLTTSAESFARRGSDALVLGESGG